MHNPGPGIDHFKHIIELPAPEGTVLGDHGFRSSVNILKGNNCRQKWGKLNLHISALSTFGVPYEMITDDLFFLYLTLFGSFMSLVDGILTDILLPSEAI